MIYIQGYHLHDRGLWGGKTQVRDSRGRHAFLVSTVQLGPDSHQFETRVFSERGVGAAIPGLCVSYDSPDDACAGHCDICNGISDWDPDQGPLRLALTESLSCDRPCSSDPHIVEMFERVHDALFDLKMELRKPADADLPVATSSSESVSAPPHASEPRFPWLNHPVQTGAVILALFGALELYAWSFGPTPFTYNVFGARMDLLRIVAGFLALHGHKYAQIPARFLAYAGAVMIFFRSLIIAMNIHWNLSVLFESDVNFLVAVFLMLGVLLNLAVLGLLFKPNRTRTLICDMVAVTILGIFSWAAF